MVIYDDQVFRDYHGTINCECCDEDFDFEVRTYRLDTEIPCPKCDYYNYCNLIELGQE